MKSWLNSASRLKDTSIRNKLLIAPAILILTLALITGLAMYGLNVQAEALYQVNEITLEQIKLIDQFSLLSKQVQSDVYQMAVLRFMEAPEAETQPVQVRLERGVIELKIMYGEIVTRWPLDESERSILEDLKTHMDDFTLQAQQAVQSVAETPSFGVLLVRSSTLSYTQFSETLAELRDYKDSKISRTQKELIQKTGALKTTIITLVLLMALAGIILNIFISARLIVRPIRETTHLMNRLAEDDLSIEVLGLERKDEIGDMLRAMGVFRNNAIEKARLDKELLESQKRFALSFHSSPYAITITRAANGQMIEVNEGFANITGYSTAESINKTTLDLNLWADEQDRAFVVSELAKGNPVSGMEFRFRVKDGSIIIGLFSANTITLGDQPCILSSINDITERVQAERELERYRNRLEELVLERTRALETAQEKLVRHERLAVLGQLAGGVGHELRNPLGVISNAIYYLNMVLPGTDEKVREYLALIQKNTQEATRIVTDLLDFSRVKSVDRSAVNVSEIIDVVFSQHPAPKNVTIDMELPDDLPLAHVDQLHIKQVLSNLVTNAFQAMPDGGRLTVASRAIEGIIEISIADTGSGITPENQDKIFEPLFTTKAKGIGLGLAICKNLIEANGGKIDFESEVGEGSIFRLHLPVYEGEK